MHNKHLVKKQSVIHVCKGHGKDAVAGDKTGPSQSSSKPTEDEIKLHLSVSAVPLHRM